MRPVMLKLEGVRLERGGVSVFANLELMSPMTGLVGRSGCGKTTLLHSIAGLFPPSAGRITIGDTTVCDVEAGVSTPPYKRRAGLAFQDVRLFPHLTVQGNLQFSARGRSDGVKSGNERALLYEEVVHVLDLGSLLRRRPQTLSGGEARRVAIGRMLMSRPRILLLDEPMAGLDDALAARVLEYIVRVREHFEVPAVLCSHNVSLVDGVADQVLTIHQGRLQVL